ncbi:MULTISPECIES: class I ribonucleotide reductase maintenance protein YfaE [unclassified Shewanella]|uniref:class I ribonucleotide reductase maintenance protein YfaE n=1 Tax=unclassified Shewanella TaxID=196818 RepID=UPI000C8211C4|nr:MULTISPECIES: class I ribonucleotide reductase maintenance protein YfaE [unclassified Shewanella]MDO6640502.1 class I ribonucleotide reductase maintenance protein YfaE [Shewanella sp. 5_MG-2023]MDO6678847.1 class I ribonucleotide reductase maintenance protein YfaE [Shewanella sp. 4_MG-2023]MDO6776179.1 class I ribonucleotide reductase maintenance protein YfaE [Shewanella sp. 3_MG-2023]
MTYNRHLKKAPIVSLNGEPVLLFNQQQHTLLEVLEIKKVNVFSECRRGFCGACKTKIISGKVSYITEPLVELEADECLPCCCVPDSNIDLDLTTDEPSNIYVQQRRHLLVTE